MDTIQTKILKFIARRDYSPMKSSDLTHYIGIADSDYPKYRTAITQLQNQGKIVKTRNNLIKLPDMAGIIIGTYQANPRGFGFVIPHEANSHGDLFIGHGDHGGAMTGDTVMAKAVKKGMRGGKTRYNGYIIDVIDRKYEKIVGTLKKYDRDWAVEADGSSFIEPIIVNDVSAKNAKAEDKVIVEIIDFPTDILPARGVITEVIGKTGMYEAEIRSIIAQYHFPTEFPSSCIDQARRAAESFNPDAATGRDDITNEVIITIDPPDAKDFDDAISLQVNSDNNWVLGVHIADVSEFIHMDSPLDIEAKQRGNSIYLPGKVIPMLPEILSNGICSLQPNVKRFAKSVYITYDRDGKVLGREFANSIIQSNARLTYKQADDVLHGKAHGIPGEVVALLKDMETLAQTIEKRREKNGMIHLELPETELIMDDQGKVVDAVKADDCYPHTLIEMFMVEANDAVATVLDRFGVPFLRRIHPAPDVLGLKKVNTFVKICGLKLPRVLDRHAIQDLLKMVKGKSHEYAVNMYILRSLQRAEYSPAHIGHFALASTHYCHFTSPIRRYADLLVHRLIDCYIKGSLNKIGLEEVIADQELKIIGKQITYTEQQAEEAERELKLVLILQMLSDHIGEELNCIVSSLTNFGIFVQCKKFGVEGLIEFGDLGMDQWRYNEKVQAVVGENSGRRIHLGQEMRVRIASVNVAARRLYLAPVEQLVKTRLANSRKISRKKRRKYA